MDWLDMAHELCGQGVRILVGKFAYGNTHDLIKSLSTMTKTLTITDNWGCPLLICFISGAEYVKGAPHKYEKLEAPPETCQYYRTPIPSITVRGCGNVKVPHAWKALISINGQGSNRTESAKMRRGRCKRAKQKHR